jgi:hypothetical protein
MSHESQYHQPGALSQNGSYTPPDTQQTIQGQSRTERLFQALEANITAALQRIEYANQRITQLEKHIHYPNLDKQNIETALKIQAAQQQAMQPLTNDVKAIRELGALARNLLNPEVFGHAVTFEVRQAARRALGLPEVKRYDL